MWCWSRDACVPSTGDYISEEWFGKLDAAISKDRHLERDVFVVSTQCLEVGANLDFDHLTQRVRKP